LRHGHKWKCQHTAQRRQVERASADIMPRGQHIISSTSVMIWGLYVSSPSKTVCMYSFFYKAATRYFAVNRICRCGLLSCPRCPIAKSIQSLLVLGRCQDEHGWMPREHFTKALQCDHSRIWQAAGLQGRLVVGPRLRLFSASACKKKGRNSWRYNFGSNLNILQKGR
jgi:hypothetical protein